jgi:PhnB protein
MKAVNPYLNFSDNCEAAFNFYKSVFGGEFVTVMRFKDVPAGEIELPADEAEKIMHIALPIGQGTILMGSDTVVGTEV